ncbi:hypothetical protein [Methylobacterium ajmalii]|uniref:hypothetical protein n=1 Tax=Methylobacterium ajmalii TaxID=2738439 RepID=UPI002F35EA56
MSPKIVYCESITRHLKVKLSDRVVDERVPTVVRVSPSLWLAHPSMRPLLEPRAEKAAA